MNKVGVAFFNDGKSPSSGISYLDGLVTQFESIADLDMSVPWIADLTYKDFQNAGFGRYSQFRPEQYLRIGISVIMRELGIKKNIEGAEIVGQFVDSIVEDMHQMVGADPFEQPYRLHCGMLKSLLPSFYQEALLNKNVAVAAALENAYQANQGSHKSNHANQAKLHHYTFPRLAHFEYLLNQNFPINDTWKEMEQFKKPLLTGIKRGIPFDNFQQVHTELRNLHKDTACILNVRVKSMEDSHIQGFSFGVEGARSNIRLWAPLPEVIELMNYAQVEIIGGFETAAGKLPIRPQIDLTINRYSYPRGVVAENIWIGLSEPVRMNGNKYATGLGVYMRAYDRLLCGKLAQAFAKSKFKLGGFGTGGVKVWARSQDKPKIDSIAARFGAMPDLKG